MNGVQQVERFTAVRRAELKIADLEIILFKLAEEINSDRRSVDELKDDLVGLGLAIREDRDDRRQDDFDRDHRISLVYQQIDRFETQTFWQRLRWIVRGR